MANTEGTPLHPEARLNQDLWRRSRDARASWDVQARDAIDFVLGNQYTREESIGLQSIGQADFVLDRLYPAIDKLKATITARKPSFTALAREDSDNQLAQVWKVILEYVWDISKGNVQFKQSVHDYAVTGLGYWYAYIDREADYGRGEVKFTNVDPFRVYVDAASRDRYFSDAAYMLLSTFLTKEQVLNLYGHIEMSNGKPFSSVIDDLEFKVEIDYPASQQKNSQMAFTPEEVKDLDRSSLEWHQVIERFEKVKVPFFWVSDLQEGSEKVVSTKKLAEMQQVPEFAKALEDGRLALREVLQDRVKVTATLGQHFLYEEILNTDLYPIIPIPNIWTNTPYPKSDVNKTKDMQRLLNKVFSLILAHAQTSAGLKLLLPEGSVDDAKEIEELWANPTAVITYNPEYGEPHVAGSAPLAGEFYNLIERIERSIDLSFGISELDQGLASGSSGLAGTDKIILNEGKGRGRSKQLDIEESLNLLGQVLHNLCKGHYTSEKTFRIVQPNNNLTEFMVNIYDDKSGAIATITNDITIGVFDIKVDSGSSLPSNRQEEANMHLAMFDKGLVDDIEVWKKMEIYDIEGLIKRKSKMVQLLNQNQQLQEQVKKLSGDMQTADRELRHADRQVAGEKFKSSLQEILSNAKAGKKIEVGKLTTQITSLIDKAAFALKETQKTAKAKSDNK